MGYLDDSDNDSCSGSDGEYDLVAELPSKKNKGKKKGSPVSVTEGDIDQRLAAVMKLKDEYGVTQEEEKANKEKAIHQKEMQEQRELQKQKEQEATEGMNEEEKIQYRKERALSMMNKIKIKHDAMKDSSGHTEESTSTVAPEEEDEMAEFKRLKALKEAKKKKRAGRSKSPKRSTSDAHKADRPKSLSKSPMRRAKSEGTPV